LGLPVEAVVDAGHEPAEATGPRDPCRHVLTILPVVVDQQDMLQMGQALAQPGDLAPVQRLGGHQHPALTHGQTLMDRVGAERRKQRAHHAAVLQGAEHAEVQLGDAAGQHEHPLTLADPKRLQDVREPVGTPGEGKQLTVRSERGPSARATFPSTRPRSAGHLLLPYFLGLSILAFWA
jgi:hypothetical protein